MLTLIKNGMVIDPESGICEMCNVLIENDRIKELTKSLPEADRVIDADGCVVAPGFIDIHMHENPIDNKTGMIEQTILKAMLRQGVTTAVGGNCGDNYGDPVEYLDILDRNGAPINLALFAGHGYYRKKAGHKDKYTGVSKEELEKMLQYLENALDRGCIGISFGIRYFPGMDREEMLQAGSLCKKAGKLLSAHIRDDAAQVIASLREFADIGKELGVPVEVSHIGSMGGFGQMKDMLDEIVRYRKDGLDIGADCYPYYAFSTGIGSTTYDDGWMERYDCDYHVLEICEGKYKGMRATKEIFDELRKDDPDVLTVCYVMKPEDVDMAMTDPTVLLASDGVLSKGQGHPRAAGTFPRFLANYVRTGKITMMDAIRKMSFMPAQRLGLENKGRIRPGCDADLVIFDADKIQDTATFASPLQQPEGIAYVLVAGEIACHNNVIENAALGRAVRK